MMDGERLPASYANFYIGNGVVMVPTFNDPNDRIALNVLAEVMPSHQVVGIHAVDLVWGLGTLHCLTQQEAARIAAGLGRRALLQRLENLARLAVERRLRVLVNQSIEGLLRVGGLAGVHVQTSELHQDSVHRKRSILVLRELFERVDRLV